MAHSDFIPNLMQWERKEHDLYETPVEATQALINYFQTIGEGQLRPGVRVHEPASASGKIAKVLEIAGFQVTAEDIRTDNIYGTGGVNYLTSPPGDFDMVITNPPFSLAVPFIEKAMLEAPIVCMLLKSDFWQTSGRLPLFRGRLRPTAKLDMTWRLAFLREERGNSPFMNTTWIVWSRGDGGGATMYDLLEKPTNAPNIHLEGDMTRMELAFRGLTEAIR